MNLYSSRIGGVPIGSHDKLIAQVHYNLRGASPGLRLRGAMPHMHVYGRSGTQGEAAECMSEVKHWQRMFFYETPVRVTPESELSVDCRYDTSEAQAPVQPGWGTRNEMCAAIMYVTMPNPL